MTKDLVRYSMQLAMLKQLLARKLITESEYNAIKSFLYTVKCRRELTKRCTSGTFR